MRYIYKHETEIITKHVALFFFALTLVIYSTCPVFTQPVPGEPVKEWEGVVSILGETGCTSFRLDAEITNSSVSKISGQESYRLTIPVTAFRARLKMIERDFREMVRGTDYPEIVILFPFRNVTAGEPFPVKVFLAGKTLQTFVMPKIKANAYNTIELLQGETTINWKEFGLVPPRRFGGLCDVHDTIMITFALKPGS